MTGGGGEKSIRCIGRRLWKEPTGPDENDLEPAASLATATREFLARLAAI
jgi:hypothetical protein